MSSKPAVSTKQTNTQSSVRPIGEQAPMFSDLWSKASSSNVGSPFTGDLIAAPGQYSLAAPNLIGGANVGGNATNSADMARKVASGFFLDPSNDPTFQGAVNSAINPITRQLTEQVLPQITDKSIRVGGTGGGPSAYGGSSQDLQENQAVQNWGKQVADTTATMANSSRTAGMNLIPQIGNLNQAANAEALAPGQTALAAGAADTTNKQAILDNIFKKWDVNRTAPLQDFQSLANILTTGGFRDSNSNSMETLTGATPSMATQILQGLTGGAGIANSLFGSTSGGQNAVQGMMSTLGPMLAAISDRRLKHDIVKIGETENGLGIYMYHFAGTGRTEVGFMADEVKVIVPDAVTNICGVDTVDYAVVRKAMGGHIG